MEKVKPIETGAGLGQLHPENANEVKSDKTGKHSVLTVLLFTILMLGAIAVGFVVAEVAAMIHKASFGVYLWPLIASSDVFVISSFGFFAADGSAEKVYAVCAVISFIAMIIQFIVLF